MTRPNIQAPTIQRARAGPASIKHPRISAHHWTCHEDDRDDQRHPAQVCAAVDLGYVYLMPNAIKMLQDDQNSMRILFGQVQQLPAGQFGGEDEAALQIASMVSAHNTLVEEFIYPLLADLQPEMAREAEDGRVETRRMLSQIDDLPTGMDRRDALVDLQRVVKDQGEQEEAFYPLLTRTLGLVELEDLGRLMMVRQQELLHQGEDTTSAATTARPQVAATPKV